MDEEQQLERLAAQLAELCPPPPGADVVEWLRGVVGTAKAQRLDSLTATRFIDESYLRWVQEQAQE